MIREIGDANAEAEHNAIAVDGDVIGAAAAAENIAEIRGIGRL